MTTHSSGVTLDDFGLEPVTLRFLKDKAALNAPPVYDMPLDRARRGLEVAQAHFRGLPPATAQDLIAPCGPDGHLHVRILRPVDAQGPLPLVVYFHGGGWVLGSPDSHNRLGRDLVNASGAAVAMVRYSRSPEKRYPYAVEEAYAATCWLARNALSLGLDPDRVAVAGDSAGANLATAAAMLIVARGGPELRQQCLIYPVTDARCASPSYTRFEHGPGLTRAAMLWYWDQYAPDRAQRLRSTASPLLARDEELRGVAPALVVTAECDVLRDEGEEYARRLAGLGVDVLGVRVQGLTHGFAANDALVESAPARRAAGMIGRALKDALR